VQVLAHKAKLDGYAVSGPNGLEIHIHLGLEEEGK
jgi:hypothetical protein